MLPRPRVVCQEPGLRPIGRSPGVPDKSSRGLGSLSRYSAQILIYFIAYIFHFFCLFLCGFGWELCRTVVMQHALRRCSWPLKYSLAFMSQDWWNWQMKWMKSVSMEDLSIRTKWMECFFAYMWVILLYFSKNLGLIPTVLQLDQVNLFWKSGQEFDRCHTAAKQEFGSIFQAVKY